MTLASVEAAGLRQETLFRLPWGSGDGQAGLSRAAGGPYGPSAIAVEEKTSTIFILDSRNERIVAYASDGQTVAVTPIGERGSDLTLVSAGNFLVLDSSAGSVHCYTAIGGACGEIMLPLAESPLIELRVDRNGVPRAVHANGSSSPIALGARALSIDDEAAPFAELVPNDGARLRFPATNADVDIPALFGTIATVRLLGTDERGNAYVVIEETLGDDVIRSLRVYRADGILVAEGEIPWSDVAYVPKDLVVVPSGDIYQLMPLEDGVEVSRWRVVEGEGTGANPRRSRQQSRVRPAAERAPRADGSFVVQADAISQQQVMSRAQAYATHTFVPHSNNFTSTAVCDSKGIDTPAWMTANVTNTAVPYKWGGFSGLAGVTSYTNCSYFFDAGLAAGKYAGDINTSQPYGVCCAVGVDCSGFVSQAWGLSQHHGTGQLKDITCPLPSLDDMITGDVANNYPAPSNTSNHIRLFSNIEPGSGYFTVYESSGRDDRVSKFSYSRSGMSGYLPYRPRAVSGLLSNGNGVKALATINVRTCAGLSCSAPTTETIGGTGTIDQNSQEVDGYIWWHIQWADGKSGWSAQCYLGKTTASGGPTLTAQLSASPASGPAPLSTTLTATASGSSGTLNYAFWWNCNDPGVSVSSVSNVCGALPTPSNGSCSSNSAGYKCNAVSTNPKSTSATYQNAGTYTAKVIIEQGSATPAEARKTITVSSSNQCAFSLSTTEMSVGGGNGGGSFMVHGSPSGCTGSWSASTSTSWLQLTGETGGSGSSSWRVSFSFPVNPSTINTRTGTIDFTGNFPSGSTMVVTQDPSAGTLRPDFAPYQPSGWPAPLIVSTSAGTRTNVTQVPAGTYLYVDWAISNGGTAAATATTQLTLLVDGGQVGNWPVSPPWGTNTYAVIDDHPIGVLAPGTHTISIVADATFAVTELNETNNTGTATIVVGAATGTPAIRGDFNSDRTSDILWRNTSTGANSIWYITNGALIGGLTLPRVTAPTVIVAGVGDFNRDGYSDILWRNGTTGANSIWYITAAGFIGGAAVPTVTVGGMNVAAVADFNNDGYADLFWRDEGTGRHHVWLMRNGSIVGGSQLPTITGTSFIGSGDFNGDGTFDLLWRNLANGTNWIWFLSNGAFTGAGGQLPTVSGTAVAVAGIGDFNNDGRFDLLWRNPTTGQNSTWLLNGAVMTGGSTLPSAVGSSLTIVSPK